MFFYEYQPQAQLSPYIEKIWYCKTNEHNFTCLSSPLLHHELIINLSESYNFERLGNKKETYLNPKSWLSGLQSSSLHVQSSGQHEMIGVLFKPHGLKAFNRHPSRDFEQEFIEPSLVFGAEFDQMLETLEGCESHLDKIKVLHNFLLKNRHEITVPLYLAEAVRLLSTENETAQPIRMTCNELGISNKSLIETFNKHIGTTPVKWLQMIRINKALKSISANPGISLTTLAYDLNFADQAHFSNQFKKAVGLSPSEYSLLSKAGSVDPEAPQYIFLEG